MDCKIVNGNLIVPEGTKKIDNRAFQKNGTLETAVIPEGVVEIGEYAFWECENLKQVSLPKSLKKIGDYAFSGCRSLESVTIPEGVVDIGKDAFLNCENLKQASLPKGLKKIGDSAFSSCKSLECVTIPEGIVEIGKDAFWNCKNLKLVSLPKSLKKIGKWAYYCSNELKLAVIPVGITELGERAFGWSCSEYVVAETEGTPNRYVRNWLEKEGERYKVISRPDGLVAKSAIVDGVLYYVETEGEIITIPAGVKVIAPYAAAGQGKTKKIILPDSVEEIQHHAFVNCKELESITFGRGIKKIGYQAFGGLTGKAIEIPDSVEEVATTSFGEGCTLLMEGETARLQEIETCRKDAEETNRILTALTQKENALKAELVAHIQARPEAFSAIPEEQHQAHIQQARAELDELNRRWKWAFLLMGSKKKALKENIENKQKELEALQAQQKWASHREAKARELAVASEKRQRCADRLVNVQNALRTASEDLKAKKALYLKTEKKRILAQIGTPQDEKTLAYKNAGMDTDVKNWLNREETVLNQAFSEAMRIQAYNRFAELHGRDLSRIRKINAILKRPEDDGIEQFTLGEKTATESKLFPACPACFEKLNASYRKTASWIALWQAGEKIGCKKASAETAIGFFFANSECICLLENEDCLVLLPFFIVEYRTGQSLSVFSYADTKVSSIHEEIRTSDTTPEGGEVIKWDYTYTNKDGSRNMRYKDNPMIKTVRFTRIEIRNGNHVFWSAAIPSRAAEEFEKAYKTYAKNTGDEKYREAYELMPTVDELNDFEDKIRKHEQKKAEEMVRKRAEAAAERARKKAEAARLEAEKEEVERKKLLRLFLSIAEKKEAERIAGLKKKKRKILREMGKPVCDPHSAYEYTAEEDTVEAQLNKAYLSAVRVWNRYSRAVAINEFMEAHQKEIQWVREINKETGCQEDDGITQYATLQKVPELKESYFPQHVARVNEYFSQTKEWIAFKGAWERGLGTVLKALSNSIQEGRFLAGNAYFYLRRENALWLFFPCFMVKWADGQPLKLVSYNKVKVSAESTEREIVGEVPADGEFLSERYMFLNKDGTPSRRYKDNPLIKTVRFSTVSIGGEGVRFVLSLPTYREAAWMQEEMRSYIDIFSVGMYAELYKAVRNETSLTVINKEIRERNKAEQARLLAEEARRVEERLAAEAAAKEEAERREAERLAAQAAAEEKRRALIQKQRERNEERKQQAEQKKKIYQLFGEDAAQSTGKKQSETASAVEYLEVVSNRMISNNVFKVTVQQKAVFPMGEVVCYFVTEAGAVMSNKKKLTNGQEGKETVMGFMLLTGIDYTQIKKCQMRIESQGTVIGEIDFKVSIAFCPDF